MFHTDVHKNVNVVEKQNQTIFGFGSNTHFGAQYAFLRQVCVFRRIFRKHSAEAVMLIFSFCGVVRTVGSCFGHEFIKDPIQVSAHESEW